jgi:hypothetical protein
MEKERFGENITSMCREGSNGQNERTVVLNKKRLWGKKIHNLDDSKIKTKYASSQSNTKSFHALVFTGSEVNNIYFLTYNSSTGYCFNTALS